MTDVNTRISSDSSLAFISTGDIDDRGEITGQACVLSNSACTSEQPAFFAIPDAIGTAKTARPSTNAIEGERAAAVAISPLACGLHSPLFYQLGCKVTEGQLSQESSRPVGSPHSSVYTSELRALYNDWQIG